MANHTTRAQRINARQGKIWDVALGHQIKIAKQTLRYSDAGALIMGGMTKEQARDVLHVHAGWSTVKIQDWEDFGYAGFKFVKA